VCCICNIYISRLCYDASVHLSVTEVHWRIIANLGFKFRSKFTAEFYRALRSPCCLWARGKGSSSPGRVEGSSPAMLATARLACTSICAKCHAVTGESQKFTTQSRSHGLASCHKSDTRRYPCILIKYDRK